MWMSVARSLYASPMIWFTNLTTLASWSPLSRSSFVTCDLVDIEHVLLHQLVQRLRADAVVPLQRLGDVGGGAERQLHPLFVTRRTASSIVRLNGSLAATTSVPLSARIGMTLCWKTTLVGTFVRATASISFSVMRVNGRCNAVASACSSFSSGIVPALVIVLMSD